MESYDRFNWVMKTYFGFYATSLFDDFSDELSDESEFLEMEEYD